MRKILTILTLLTLSLTSLSQTTRQLKVYKKDGSVDVVLLNASGGIRHSCSDLDGRIQEDYVSMVVTDAEGLERQYLISQLDSLVLPGGRRVVFHGSMLSQPLYSKTCDGWVELPRRAPRRTSFSGSFPGTPGTGNVTFFWTENDHIRLDIGSESRAEGLTNNNTDAEFVFEDLDFESPSYMVYFPDKSVTIPMVQTQTGADNTEHIGQSGDCGVATATLDGDSYRFTLQHKAAYLCFLPHIDHLPSVRIEKIVLNCNTAIAGTYQLSNSGLYNGISTSNSITLNLTPQRDRDFFIGHDVQAEQDSCAAYMVIAPQEASRTFTATYYVTDTLSHISKVFYQTFTFQPLANTVYPVSFHIYDTEFRMVDLGLSVNWLNSNIGGLIPSDHGTYYANDVEANQALLEQTVVTEWLMPDEEQQQELLEKCTWTWGQYNGINGYFVEAPTESTDDGKRHRIFLPSKSTTQVTPAVCLAQNSRAVETLIVDMGLPDGTKWAVRNVGAQSATDFGDYYAWGETETKSSYTDENYRYGTRNLGENLNISGTQNDAAFVHWGGSWRMPTKKEWEDLNNLDYCTWEWQTVNGINGFIVTSVANGNKIFLPAAGIMYNESLYYGNSGASYFTANQVDNNSVYAHSLSFFNGNNRNIFSGSGYGIANTYSEPAYSSPKRFMGKPVRPVMSTIKATSDGMELTIQTDSASWKLGDTQTTLYGSLRSTTPIKGEVTVGFVVGDSAAITVDEKAGGVHNYRYKYSTTTTTAGRITYSLPVYDNIGYWYRAFVQTSDTVMYGTPRHYAYEMVDLGLESGTLWANMNLGANAPEETGNYYAWGETETKSDYQSSTYRFASLTQNIGYNHDISGTQYDAAHINMGNAWRMPTFDDMKELRDDCVWEHVTQNSTNGYRVTGPNGNTIFLPDAGLMYGTSLHYYNSGGSYFTSTQVSNNNDYAHSLSFYGSSRDIYSSAGYSPFSTYGNPGYISSRRDIGKPVRAVASLGNIEGDNAYTVLTDSATWKLGDTQATIYGTISMLRPVEGTVEVGFIIGDSANITKTGEAYYSKTVSDRCRLQTTVPVYDNMGYWYRTYLAAGDTIFYGEALHFGWEMVDLGLPTGTLWANMNVGASLPEDYGNYYAWGETEEKQSYTNENYTWGTQNLGNDYSISQSDMDAAHVNMRNVWRMPTDEEAKELLNNCDWEWELCNGVNGYRVKSRKPGNKNSIFLPAAGLKYEGAHYYRETGACYATSVAVGDASEYAYTLSFNGGTKNVYSANSHSPFSTYNYPGYYSSKRFMGKAVRAVATPNAVMADGKVLDIQTDSAVWKLDDTQAAVYATIVSNQAVNDGLTVGFVFGSSPQVDKASALMEYHKTITEVCSYSHTVSVQGNMGYWYRAYVEKDGEVKYGEAKHFGWEMVDLGLPSGTLWANMNVGSSSPEEYGSYFAWGETHTKQSYTEDNYQYRVEGVYQTIGDNGNIAATNFDAARVTMGEAWQMPTVIQCQELLNSSYCKWTPTLLNGVKGYWVTSVVAGYEGCRIFLPNAGLWKGGSPLRIGSSGSYYTSQIGGNSGQSAYTLTWNGNTRSVYRETGYTPYSTYDSEEQKAAVFRYMGRPVRAVSHR